LPPVGVFELLDAEQLFPLHNALNTESETPNVRRSSREHRKPDRFSEETNTKPETKRRGRFHPFARNSRK
jgi:hypothetical protein